MNGRASSGRVRDSVTVFAIAVPAMLSGIGAAPEPAPVRAAVTAYSASSGYLRGAVGPRPIRVAPTINPAYSGPSAHTANVVTTGRVALSNGNASGADEGSVRVMSRISALRALDDGWMGPGSLAPAPHVLDEVARARQFIPRTAHIAPAADGSVVIEWEARGHEFLLSLDVTDRLIFVEEEPDGTLVREAEVPYSDAQMRELLTSGA